MVVQRPPDMVPLDSYMASETYMDEGETSPIKPKEQEPVPVPQG